MNVSPIKQPSALIPIAMSLAALALVLGAPSHMLDAFGFARPVSPLLLWIIIEAVCRKTWSAMAPPILVSLSVSLVFAKPFVTVLKGVLGR